MGRDALNGVLHAAEAHGGLNFRITKVWHDEPGSYIGLYGVAPIEQGEPAYQTSDGQIIKL